MRPAVELHILQNDSIFLGEHPEQRLHTRRKLGHGIVRDFRGRMQGGLFSGNGFPAGPSSAIDHGIAGRPEEPRRQSIGFDTILVLQQPHQDGLHDVVRFVRRADAAEGKRVKPILESAPRFVDVNADRLSIRACSHRSPPPLAYRFHSKTPCARRHSTSVYHSMTPGLNRILHLRPGGRKRRQ
ncbi:MAG: hypothetical protein AMXMBFR13_18170 [Phycisphaerae bacterium]